MELYIGNVNLSSLGVRILEIQELAPEIDLDLRYVSGRSGGILTTSRYDAKRIKARGRLLASSVSDFEDKRKRLNQLISSREPYYISKYIPVKSDIYDFELPGQKTGDFEIQTKPLGYSWKVLSPKGLEHSFKGRSSRGYLYIIEIEFQTVDLPFGQSPLKTITLTNGSALNYQGTTPCSQLELPFEVTSNIQTTVSNPYIQIGSRKLTISGSIQGQLTVRGHEVKLGTNNINHRTNYEYFVLLPGNNAIKTNLPNITVKNYSELFL